MSSLSIYNTLLKYMGFTGWWEAFERLSFTQSISVPPVWHALNKITEDVGQLPLCVKKITRAGDEIDYNHPGYNLLMEQPNEIQPPSLFKQQVTAHAIMYGNGRAAIIRDENGVPLELLPMLPDRTWTFLHKGTKYHVTKPEINDEKNLMMGLEGRGDDRGFIAFKDTDVIHICGFSYDGVEGIGLMHIGQYTFSIGYNSQKHYDQQLKKGFRGKLFVEAPPGRFRDYEEAKKFIEEFNETEGGSDNSWKASLLREGMKVSAVNMSNNDAQFESMWKVNRQDVGMLFGLESMPGDGSPKSYNSLEQYSLMYGRALDRWLNKWEEQSDMKLRTNPQKIRRSHYYQFDRKAIYRTDRQIEVDTLCKLVQHTIYSPNDARDALGMNKREGGDVYQNPSTSSELAATTEEDTEDDSSEETRTNSQERRAVEAMVQSLIQTEAHQATRGSKSKNFVDWIEKNYAKWEPKLAEKLEAIGIDRDLARIHCEESREILLDVAGTSTPENLEENVTKAVSTWTNRVFKITGGQNDPLQS